MQTWGIQKVHENDEYSAISDLCWIDYNEGFRHITGIFITVCSFVLLGKSNAKLSILIV